MTLLQRTYTKRESQTAWSKGGKNNSLKGLTNEVTDRQNPTACEGGRQGNKVPGVPNKRPTDKPLIKEGFYFLPLHS